MKPVNFFKINTVRYYLDPLQKQYRNGIKRRGNGSDYFISPVKRKIIPCLPSFCFEPMPEIQIKAYH
jgi:hypothetical protein